MDSDVRVRFSNLERDVSSLQSRTVETEGDVALLQRQRSLLNERLTAAEADLETYLTNVTLSVFNVKRYGAVGDGTTDDTAAIQATLNLAAATGGAVYFPKGTYLVTACLNVGSKTSVFGDGIGISVILGIAGAYPAVAYNGTDVVATFAIVGRDRVSFSHLTVDHQTNNTLANPIAFMPAGNFTGTVCTNISVRSCEILGHESHQYLLWSMRGQHVRFQDNIVNGGNAAYVEDQNGIEVYGGYDIVITGNDVSRCSASGICVLSATPVYDNTEAQGIVIANNLIASCNRGILLNPASDGPSGPQHIKEVQVHHNIIRDCNALGIHLLDEYTDTDTAAINIDRNIISGAPIGIQATSTQAKSGLSRAVRITGNTIRNASHASFGAIYVALIPNVTIEGNEIYNATYDGIRLTALTGLRVAGNRIYTAGHRAIHSDGITDGTFTDNTIDSSAQTGIMLDSSPVRCMVSRNHIRETGAGQLSILVSAGSYCGVEHNDIYRALANSTNDIVNNGTNQVGDINSNMKLGPNVGLFLNN